MVQRMVGGELVELTPAEETKWQSDAIEAMNDAALDTALAAGGLS